MRPKTRSNGCKKDDDDWDRSSRSSRRSHPTESSDTEEDSEEYETMTENDEGEEEVNTPETSTRRRSRRNSSAAETKTPASTNGSENPGSSGRYRTRRSSKKDTSTNMPSVVPCKDSDSRDSFDSTEVVRNRKKSRLKQELCSEDDENDFEDMYSGLKKRRVNKVNYSERSTRTSNMRGESPRAEPILRRLRDRSRLSNSTGGQNMAGVAYNKSDLLQLGGRSRPHKRDSANNSPSSSDSSDDDCQPHRSQKRKKSGLKAGGTSFIKPDEVDPGTTFQSVGGLDSVINKLREVVMLPLIYKDFYSARGLHAPKGILFYGHPGTGKTLLARALVNECTTIGGRKVSFFVRKGADLLSKYVGESEKQIRNLFEHASQMQPSIIFFDEIDGIAPARSTQTDQTYNSVIATLLAEMDGLKNRGDIVVIGATNRLDSVDPAFRRPGRFDFEVQFSLPLEAGRKDILIRHTSLWKQEVPHVAIDALAKKTTGFSGADLQLLCAEASLIALRRRYPQIYNSTNKFVLDYESVMVELHDWIEALEKIRPSSNRSSFTNSMQPMPLPEAVDPLLRKQVAEIHEVLKRQHPIMDYPSLLREPAPKRILISSNAESDGLNDFVLPAIVHKLGIQQTFLLRPEALIHSEVLPDSLAINQVFDQAEQTGKLSVVILPEIDKLFQGLSSQAQEVLCRRIKSACLHPLLVVATSRANLQDFCSESEIRMIQELFDTRHELTMSTKKARKRFFNGVLNSEALMVRLPKQTVPKPMEMLELAPPPEPPKMSKSEQMQQEKRDKRVILKLRMFLREVLAKVARGKKYEEFMCAVDKKKVPDYYRIIKKPMCLAQISHKIDSGEYLCLEDFQHDVFLIRDNAANYNPKEDYHITHKAHALVDQVDLLLDEVDPEFAATCIQIADRLRNTQVAQGASTSNSHSSSPTVETSESHRNEKKFDKDMNPRPKKQRKVSSDSAELQVSSSTTNMEESSVSMDEPASISNIEILDLALLNRTAKPSENWESNCKLMKTICKAAARQTGGVGIYGLLNLRYNLMTLIYRHWEQEDKTALMNAVISSISNFLEIVDKKDEGIRSKSFLGEVSSTEPKIEDIEEPIAP